MLRDISVMNSRLRHRAYDRMGGVKLNILHPNDVAEDFNYQSVSGAVEAHLANFGRF